MISSWRCDISRVAFPCLFSSIRSVSITCLRNFSCLIDFLMLSAWGADICARHLWKLSEKSYVELIQSFFFFFFRQLRQREFRASLDRADTDKSSDKTFQRFYVHHVFPVKPSSVRERYHGPNTRHRTQLTKNVYHKQLSLNRYTHTTTLAPCRLEATEYSFCYSCKENSYNL